MCLCVFGFFWLKSLPLPIFAGELHYHILYFSWGRLGLYIQINDCIYFLDYHGELFFDQDNKLAEIP